MTESTAGPGVRLRNWLMTGVSYMIPFVAAGGILMAMAFLVGGDESFVISPITSTTTADDAWAAGTNLANPVWWGALLMKVGQASFGLLVPVLSGFIAYAIADRPGLAPGFIGGAIATTVNAGFLGGLVTGLMAGGLAFWMSRWRVPSWIRPVMPVVIIPLLSSLLVGALMFMVLGSPIAALMNGLEDWLVGLSGAGIVVVGLVMGLMIAFDMGGPINKVAYAFATAGVATALSEGSPADDSRYVIMAAVMAAGMTPPLGLALATAIRKKLFTESERQSGKAAWLLGAAFITEGAIPFAAVDPVRVIPALMIGSGISGALTAVFGCALRAPHGGVFVFGIVGPTPLHIVWYVLAVIVGTLTTAMLVLLAKGFAVKNRSTEIDREASHV